VAVPVETGMLPSVPLAVNWEWKVVGFRVVTVDKKVLAKVESLVNSTVSTEENTVV
jgi:hypothetical protein